MKTLRVSCNNSKRSSHSTRTITALMACWLGLILGCQIASQRPFFLTGDQLQSLIKTQYPIELETKSGENSQHYFLNVLFEKQNAGQYYVLDIETTEYGTLLSDEKFEADRLASMNGDQSAQHKVWFPDIGSRAQRFLLGFGPGGASEQIRFSTDDRALDVQVTISHNLPESVEIESNIDEVAKNINVYYNSQRSER